MFKPVDVDVYVVEAEKGLPGKVYVAVAIARIPSEVKPKVTAFIVPPSELKEKSEKYKGKVKKISIDSDEFKSLDPMARQLVRQALRSPSSYIPEEVIEELEG